MTDFGRYQEGRLLWVQSLIQIQLNSPGSLLFFTILILISNTSDPNFIFIYVCQQKKKIILDPTQI